MNTKCRERYFFSRENRSFAGRRTKSARETMKSTKTKRKDFDSARDERQKSYSTGVQSVLIRERRVELRSARATTGVETATGSCSKPTPFGSRIDLTIYDEKAVLYVNT